MITSISYKGFTIQVEQDDGYGCHPRHDWDPIGVISSWDTSQRVKNECDFQPCDDDLIPDRNPFETDEGLYQLRYTHYLFNVKMVAILPVFERYDGYSTVGNYSNQIGFIYMTKDAWKENFGDQTEWKEEYHPGKTDKEIAEYILKSEIESLNAYARGEVYGYTIDKLDDSCWGYLGDYEKSGLIDDAKDIIDYHIQRECEKHFNQLKAWIKHKVNLFNRHGLYTS